MNKYIVSYAAPDPRGMAERTETIEAERFEFIPANSNPGLMTVSCIVPDYGASVIFYGPDDEVVFAVSSKYLSVRPMPQ